MCAWLEFISLVGSFTQFNGCTYILLPQDFGELNIRNHNLFICLNYRFIFLICLLPILLTPINSI